MSHNIASLKPLFLTEEEALALLDMTLMSASENDPTKERAMLKLTDLVRRYLTAERKASEESTLQATDAISSEAERNYLPAASLLSMLQEFDSVPMRSAERSLDKKMSQHTGRVYFGRYRQRKSTLAYLF